jgi:hypothetical protein
MAKRTRKRSKDRVKQPPVRLCCGERHWTVACPDGRVMCAMCFDRYLEEMLATTPGGTKIDVCQECYDADQKLVAERRENLKELRAKAQKRVNNDLLLWRSLYQSHLQEPASAPGIPDLDVRPEAVQV